MNEAKSDRFFRAMVLMGSAVALGCGGSTSRSDDGSGGSGPTGTGGTGGSGSGGSGPGGTGPGGTGGAIFIDPTSATATTSVEPGPFPCVPAQMECGSAGSACAGTYDGWRIPEGCSCSDTRPASAADCGPDQSFVCLWGTERSDGTPYTEPVPFECSCLERGLSCYHECTAAGWNRDAVCESVTGEGGAAGAANSVTLCGCAVIVLK